MRDGRKSVYYTVYSPKCGPRTAYVKSYEGIVGKFVEIMNLGQLTILFVLTMKSTPHPHPGHPNIPGLSACETVPRWRSLSMSYSSNREGLESFECLKWVLYSLCVLVVSSHQIHYSGRQSKPLGIYIYVQYAVQYVGAWAGSTQDEHQDGIFLFFFCLF